MPSFAQAADSATSTPADGLDPFSRRAEAAYLKAQKRLQAETNNAEAEWQFGRASFDWADLVTSDADRERIALEGIAACRDLVARDAASVPGHYYLALNLGQLARTKKLGALKVIGQMETELKTTLSLDPKYDYAGADRGLGLLYRDAPGWPVSFGSKSKSRLHLQRALKTSPDYPENLLNLIEAELKWGDRKDAVRDLKVLDELWPIAKQQFTGEAWESSWVDWAQRRREVQEKLIKTRAGTAFLLFPLRGFRS